MTCPRCGKSDIRQVTPGWFECKSLFGGEYDPRVDAWVPPFPCGHRFQAGLPGSEACGIPQCGRDSIGRCQGSCDRRLCGLHGASTGSLVCADCLAVRARHQAERDADAAGRVAARHERLVKELERASTPADLLRCLAAADDTFPLAPCARAWVAVVGARLLTPSAELVDIDYQKRGFWGGSWVETARAPAWAAGASPTWSTPAESLGPIGGAQTRTARALRAGRS